MEAIFEDICFHITHYTLTVAPEGTVTSWLAAEAGRQTRRQRDTRGRTAPQRPGWGDQRREPWTRNTAEGSAPWNRSSGRSYPAHASFNRHAVVASFQFPLKLSPRSSDSHMLPPHFSFFGFLDTPKTHGEQKGLVACEEVTSTYRYDRRCWSDVLLVLMELFCFPRLVYTLCNHNNGR